VRQVPRQSPADVPRVPASAGALIHDERGRLLILKPTYKKGWTIPGGQLDGAGESPWDACRRETYEECGLVLTSGRLVCVDHRAARPKRPGGLRFVFDCGAWTETELAAIRLQQEEIEDCRLAELGDALLLLSPPLRRRVAESAGQSRCVYLEEGRPVRGVSWAALDGA
jgi:ADP-ribose pyrophosphatase YjhB (NUDIX family)